MTIAKNRFNNYKKNSYPSHKETLKGLANGQSPEVFFITCADSRVMPTDITGSSPGELFVMRNAGNLVPAMNSQVSTSEALTLEYAVSVLKVKEIIVCGHVSCGAMGGILNLDQLTGLSCVHSHLKNCSDHFDESFLNGLKSSPDKAGALNDLIESNVRKQMTNIYSYEFVKSAVSSGDLNVYGWVYDFVNGDITYEVSLKDII